MKSPPKFQAEDRFVYRAFGNKRHERHGRIVRVCKVTAIVHFDGETTEVRMGLESLRPETFDSLAERNRRAAIRAWRDQRPITKHARITCTSENNNEETGATVTCRTPDEMRGAAVELLLLADWYASRPTYEAQLNAKIDAPRDVSHPSDTDDEPPSDAPPPHVTQPELQEATGP